MPNKIKYKLYPNALTNGADNYRATVEPYKSLNLEDIVNEMEFRHSSLTPADMLAMFEDFHRTIVKRLSEGDRINIDLLQFSLSIKGNFTGENDQFDPSRHKLVVRVNPSRDFQQTVTQRARFEKQTTETPAPELHQYYNLEGSEPHTVLTPTHMARIKGQRLSFDQSDPQQGLFITPVNGTGQETNGDIRVERFSRATRGQLVFRVPDQLPAGHYRLEVRAIFGNNDLRTGTLRQVLEVK